MEGSYGSSVIAFGIGPAIKLNQCAVQWRGENENEKGKVKSM